MAIDDIPIGKGEGKGWHRDSMPHSLAKKFGSAGGTSTKNEPLLLPHYATGTGISKEQFRESFPEYEKGEPKLGMTEFIPRHRICVECERQALEESKPVKYRFKVRPDVMRQAMYKHGGLPALRREYKCRLHREHGISKSKIKEPGKGKLRKDFTKFYEGLK